MVAASAAGTIGTRLEDEPDGVRVVSGADRSDSGDAGQFCSVGSGKSVSIDGFLRRERAHTTKPKSVKAP